MVENEKPFTRQQKREQLATPKLFAVRKRLTDELSEVNRILIGRVDIDTLTQMRDEIVRELWRYNSTILTRELPKWSPNKKRKDVVTVQKRI